MNAPAETPLTQGAPGYRIDDLIIDVGRLCVMRGDEVVALPALSFDLLLALVRAAPNLVTYEQLMDQVWTGVIVSPETVSQRVRLVRDALGDDPLHPHYIAGLRGRGYRVLPRVEPLAATTFSLADAPTPVTRGLALTVRTSTSPAPNRVRWLTATILAASMLVAGTVFVTQWHAERKVVVGAKPTSVAVQPSPSIAVLPFANIGDDPENEYFSDGLSEELLNRLVAVPELHVAARTSSFYFKNRPEDIKRIGQMLSVRHVLEGSVRKQGDRIRVTARLVSTQDGYELWSRNYDRQVLDLFQLQDEIALAVVDDLQPTLAGRAHAVLTEHSTSNVEAFDLYLRGKHLYQSLQPERIDKAVQYFEKAIKLDPSFSAAYVSLADAIWFRAHVKMDDSLPYSFEGSRPERLLRKAIELDPRNAEAHAVIGHQLTFGLHPDAAAREILQAEAINPNGELVLRYVARYYSDVGWPPEKGIGYARRGLQLDPLNPLAAVTVSDAYSGAQQDEAALAAADEALELNPDFWMGHWARESALIDLGRYEEALAAAKRAVELSDGYGAYADLVISYAKAGKTAEAQKLFNQLNDPQRKPHWRPSFRAYALAGMGRYDEALAAFEQAYQEGDGFMTAMLHSKRMIPLYDKPRFQKLVHLLGQEQRVEHTRLMNERRQHRALRTGSRAPDSFTQVRRFL